MLRELGLFAGIGGFSLGLNRAGLSRPVRLIEQDHQRQAWLRQYYPEAQIDGDIRACEFTEGEADVVTAGPPCQPVSIAGKGLADLDDRWLWPECLDVVRAVRPRFVILENPPILLTYSRLFGDILGALASLGYDGEWDGVPAISLGACHERDRWFGCFWRAFADTNGYGSQAPWLSPGQPARQGMGSDPCGPNGHRAATKRIFTARAVAEQREICARRDWREAWPDAVRRLSSLDDGLPRKVALAAIAATGDTIVPACAEMIGRQMRREFGL